MRTLLNLVILASAVTTLARDAGAQSVWCIDGPGATLNNTAGPPDPFNCNYPSGPLLASWNYVIGGGCPTPLAYPPPSFLFTLGDVTDDRVNDIVWATDGFVVTGYAKNPPAPVVSIVSPLPFPLTGLGYQARGTNSNVPVLWLTDGFHAMSVVAPTAGCLLIPAVDVPSFPLSGASHVTDIDYDPTTGHVFTSTTLGLVFEDAIGGGFVSSFFAGGTCGLTANLTGLTVDTADCGNLFLTDGVTMTRVDLTGALSPTTFYAPQTCWPYPGPGITSGLGFDATPLPYCQGCHPFGGAPPVMASIGEAISPNPTFGLTLKGGRPNSPLLLAISFAEQCPALNIGCGCTLCISPQNMFILATGGANGLGNLTLPVPIPAGWGCLGIKVHAQFIGLIGNCPYTSNALYIHIAEP